MAQLPPEGECESGRQRTSLSAALSQVPSRVFSAAWHRARIGAAGLLVALVGGCNSRRAFAEGMFRNSGEVHKWMYDRVSLTQELQRAGFTDILGMDAHSSTFPQFPCEGMDHVGGRIRKPGSLYFEARRPAGTPSAPATGLTAR